MESLMRISLFEACKEYQQYFTGPERFMRYILDNEIKVYLSRESIIDGLPVGKPHLSLGGRVEDRQPYLMKYFHSEIGDLSLDNEQLLGLWSNNTSRFISGFDNDTLTVGHLGELEVSLGELFVSPAKFIEPLIKDDKFEVEIEVPDDSCSSLIIKLGKKESIIEYYDDFAANILRVMIERYKNNNNTPCIQEVLSVPRGKAHFRKTSAFGGKYIQNFVNQKGGLYLKPRVKFN